MAFFAQKMIYTFLIYDLTICLAHFLEQDHILTLIILGVYG